MLHPANIPFFTTRTKTDATEGLFVSYLLSDLIEHLSQLFYTCDANRVCNFISAGCQSTTGYTQKEFLDKTITLTCLIHPQDRDRIHQLQSIAIARRQPYSYEYRIITKTGQIKWIWEQGVGTYNHQHQLQQIAGCLRDISNLKQAESHLHLLQNLTHVISSAPDFHAAINATLQQVCQATKWNYGEAWIPSAQGDYLEASPAWQVHLDHPDELFIEKITQARTSISQFTFSKGEGLVGQVWQGQPIWLDNIAQNPHFKHLKHRHLAESLGLKAAFGVPILVDDQVIAVLVFFMLRSHPEDSRLAQLITTVASQLGAVFQHKQASQSLQESQRRLSTLINSLPGIAFTCRNEPHWQTTYISDGCFQLTGYTSDELLGPLDIFSSIDHPADAANLSNAISIAMAQRQPYVFEYRIVTKNKEIRWVWEKGHAVYNDMGYVIGLEGFITDITDRKKAEIVQGQLIDALQQAERSYRSIFENSIAGIFQTTRDGTYLRANPALARIYGYSSPQELAIELTDIAHQLYKDPSRRYEFQTLLQENDVVSDFESEVYRRDGQIIWISETARAVRDHHGNLLYYEGTVQDITDRKRDKEQLQKQALYDPLTGLANRALFLHRLTQSLEKIKLSPDYKFAVLYLDLDRFKVVNDSLGHSIGDKLLQAIAQVLSRCVRDGDTVARLGGDEFTIILENIPHLDLARQIAERIHRSFRSPFYLDGHEIFSGVSIGIILSTEMSHHPEEVLRDADTALYRAKSLGKGRFEVFDQAMHQRAVELMQLETDLRRAVELLNHVDLPPFDADWQDILPKNHPHHSPESLSQFQVYYQPIVNLTNGQTIALEALLRWQHPQQGLITPDRFLSLAEETGLMFHIGIWMLRKACWQLRVWQLSWAAKYIQPLSLGLHINISVHELSHPAFLSNLDQILAATGLDGQYLTLEITESHLLAKPEVTNSILHELRARQIGLAIDDFGTGYSSLSYLHQFPINTLKIDRFFINSSHQQNNHHKPAKSIVNTIVLLAQNLDLQVIAEGVENAQQMQQLKDMGCNYAQGFWLSHPLNAATINQLLQQNQSLIGQPV